MKKQILFVAFFTLALIFAGNNNVFGQLNPSPYGTLPDPLTICVGDAQHPKAGNPYLYEFNPNTGPGVAVTDYKFWATKDPIFVSGTPTVTNQTDSLKRLVGGELLNYSINYQTGGLTNGVNITWSPEILSKTDYKLGHLGDPTVAMPKTSTFVVGWAEGCADNIKVWEIDPRPSFTVDIKNIDDATKLPTAAYADAVTQCVDEVRAAKYNVTSFDIDYNYGWDTLYYEVIASNFVTSWLPTFFVEGLDGTIQQARIDWYSSWATARTNGASIEGADIAVGAGATGTPATITGAVPITAAAGITNTTGGLSLIVRLVISNNNYETLAAETVGLSVAGLDAVGFDIDDDLACTVPTTAADAADDDETSRTITPRPTLSEGTTIILPNGGTTAP